MQAEREYTRKVQQRLIQLMNEEQELSGRHEESIMMILEDAWDELRLRPTAISPEELQQLASEVNRFTLRKQFAKTQAQQARQMLMRPFFARVDFLEDGESEQDKIVIGRYSLPDGRGGFYVYDWRAPICGLYYDALPGKASFESPSGRISGEMTLKRQYRMERGQLVYYVDTSLSIDDSMLLEILSSSASGHMHDIVSTIQRDQNAVIRASEDKVVCVVGSAGSGKTSVAMHRAAYLMYRRRDALSANRVQILSPSPAFSEYISNVLPELGEENIQAVTLHELTERVLGRRVEHPIGQVNALLETYPELRRESVGWKCGLSFQNRLDSLAARIEAQGFDFSDIRVQDDLFITGEALSQMYAGELKLLSPAQRLERMRATLVTRMESWISRKLQKLEEALKHELRGHALRSAKEKAAAQMRDSIEAQMDAQLIIQPEKLVDLCLADAPLSLQKARRDNREVELVWWEDALAEAYLIVRLGFVQPDRSIYHLLIDEAQDYWETALSLLNAYYPNAKVTLLGDPMQRTNPGLPECEPERWGACFGVQNAPMYTLNRCYRSTQSIAEFCARLLPKNASPKAFGREGAPVVAEAYSLDRLKELIAEYRSSGAVSVAVVTRTQGQADALSQQLDQIYRLDGNAQDITYETSDSVVACYQLTKGMEFDAVIVVWPYAFLTQGERRRIYTACSRALHRLALLADERLLSELEIVP